MNSIFLLEVQLSALYNPEVVCGDSSTLGYAFHVTDATGEEIGEVWKWQERWRFLEVEQYSAAAWQRPEAADHLYVQPGHPISGLGSSTAFGRDLLAQAEPRRPRPRALRRPRPPMVEVDTRVGIPPLPDSLLVPCRYRLVAARRSVVRK